MAAMERVFDAIDRLGVDVERVDIDGAFVHLADVAHVEAAPDLDRVLREAVACRDAATPFASIDLNSASMRL